SRADHGGGVDAFRHDVSLYAPYPPGFRAHRSSSEVSRLSLSARTGGPARRASRRFRRARAVVSTRVPSQARRGPRAARGTPRGRRLASRVQKRPEDGPTDVSELRIGPP